MLKRVEAAILEYQLLAHGDKVIVAVSGGPDSLCLLHLLNRLRDRYALTLHVAHLDHQLRGADAAIDARHVQRLSSSWGLDCTVGTADVAGLAQNRAMGIEEAARQARYSFLAQVAAVQGATKIAVGHHAGDQAETVLMHLLRGSGLAGLRGMLPRLDTLEWGAGGAGEKEMTPTIIRPLLNVSRDEIEAYCRRHDLRPRSDASNMDLSLFRNRLRHDLLPTLDAISPGIAGRLCQLADLVQADYALLSVLADEQWSSLVRSATDRMVELDLAGWRALPLALRRMTLRRAVLEVRGSARDLSFEQIKDARRVAETGHVGAVATLPAGLRLTLGYDALLIAAANFESAPADDWPLLGQAVAVRLKIPGRTELPNSDWGVEIELLPFDETVWQQALGNQDRWVAFLDAKWFQGSVVLRPRRPGDRFQPLGLGGGHSSLADFMINSRIPSGLRKLIPILAGSGDADLPAGRDQILWVAGWRIDERARIGRQTERVARISFYRLQPAAGSTGDDE